MKIKIGLFQFDTVWEDKEHNKKTILKIINSKKNKVDWLIFPEMTLTGFSMNVYKTELDCTDFDFFKNIAKESNCIVSFGGVIKNYNSLISVNPSGDILNQYFKNHLFSYGEENKYYKAGTKQEFFNVSSFNILPSICYDLRFSYLYWNNAIEADILLVVASWPESRREHWITLLKARAIENQAFIIGVNRVGNDPNVSYSGDSMVVDPLGNILLNCANKEGIFTTEIDINILKQSREKFCFLKDRTRSL